jgi:hypothetical protein
MRTSTKIMSSSDREALEQRFWSQVDRSGGPDFCWPWTGPMRKDGFARFESESGPVRADRLALAIASGRGFASEERIEHSCPVRSCCNPAHLFASRRAA